MLADPIITNSRLGTYTNFVNLLDLCGIAAPAGKRPDGLPISVTLLAASGKDGFAAALARDIQAAGGIALRAAGWSLPPAASHVAGALDETIELTVVGAHLSGMPLNGQL